MSGFGFRTVRTTVADAHQAAFPDPLEREVWFFEPTDAAVVLGSTQPVTTLDLAEVARRGIGVVRRRSGGGAVVVDAESLSWFDVWLPAEDPLYEHDVSRSTDWLGAVVAEALRSLGVEAQGPVVAGERTRWSPLVCFASLGAGEVVVSGRKAVGISQRRTRAGARYQAMVLHRFDPDATAALFAVGEDRADLADVLRQGVQAVPVDRTDLRAALERVLSGR